MSVKNRGWFVLDLYTDEGEAQATDVSIELFDHIHIDINNADQHDAAIDDDHRNINISASSLYDEEIEISRTVHLDIGKVEPFGGDE